MRILSFSFIGVVAMLCTMVNPTSAQLRDTSGDLINPGKAINEAPGNADIQLGVEQGITQGTYRAPMCPRPREITGVIGSRTVSGGTTSRTINGSSGTAAVG
jgi:hypothetical protein